MPCNSCPIPIKPTFLHSSTTPGAAHSIHILFARRLSLLSIPLRLLQRPLSDRFMHAPVLANNKPSPKTNRILQPPLHNGMSPKGGAGIRHPLSATRAANLRQHNLHKVPRVGDKRARLANLAHRRRNQITQHKLNIHTSTFQLPSKRRRPLLQERFGTGIRSQQRSRQQTTKGAHCHDQAAFSLHHPGRHNLRNSQRCNTVNGDDISHLIFRRLRERNRNSMALSHVVYQNPHIKPINQCLEPRIVLVFVLGEVHRQDLGLDGGSGVFVFDFGRQSGEFGGGAGDQDEVEPFLSELDGVLLADSVRRTGYYCPCPFGPISA